ncbi:DUF6572 domain-containing protein [Dokdonella sp.]|uniref:DUF6572 domain-containing protein n=1 Tax=Dokdonella sp. TaxID=2291710 RepID=UPI002CBD53DA|nr:hypothetical protein [Xanthomonadales bacterium]HQV73260.1 hypothetical protein [Dokdonella sp.]HQZ61806.1 hypothetical protein [Dokdonella sp.]
MAQTLNMIKPASPLSAPDNLDVIGECYNGGVDMMISTAGPLDASDETCSRLEEKLSIYLYACTHQNFAKVYPAAESGRVRIFVSDRHEVSERAREVVAKFAEQALSLNVEVCVGSPVAQLVVQADR